MADRRLVCTASWLVALGCASAPAPKREAPAATAAGVADDGMRLRLPRLRIVDTQLGEERSARREAIVVPFGSNQNGTELVYALLEQAGQKGAAAVGDLALYMTFRWRGSAVECRTRILLEGDPRLAHAPAAPAAAAQATAYDTAIDAYQPQRVDFIAEDRELSCTTVKVPVTRKRPILEASDRTAEAGALRDLPSQDEEVVTTYETHDQCSWVKITRPTTRYDYEVKLGFVPPNWEHLGARFAKRKIVAGTPRCYTITDEELAKQGAYRMTATAYHRGKLQQRAPRVMPTRAAVDAQVTPMNMSQRDCERMLKAATGKKYGPGRPPTGPEDALRSPPPDVQEAGLFAQCSREQQLRNLRRERGSAFIADEEVDAFEDLDDELPFDAD